MITDKRLADVLMGVLLLFLTGVSHGGDPSGQIKSLAISPDGKLIAIGYVKGDTSFIYTLPVDTGKAKRLTDAKSGVESNPAFSADGKRIAYSCSPGGSENSRIIMGNVDGSGRRSWSPSDVSDLRPVFSPDNKTLVFERSGYYGSYSPIAQPHSHDWDLYASDLGGTKVRQLTNEQFYLASPPSISPDGKSLAVVTEGGDTNREIVIYSLDHPGKPTQALQPHVPREADHKNPILTSPNYMPDGKTLLFMDATNGGLGKAYDYDVYRVDIASGVVRRLTQGNGFATDLKVSADGTTGVFLKWQLDRHRTPTKSDIYLLDIKAERVTAIKITGLD